MNTPELVPAPITTDAGAVSTLSTTDKSTFAPPAGATLVKVTVHVLELDGPSAVGLHTSDDTNTGATRLIVALVELLLYVAVTVALWLLPIVVVVALNVAVVAAAATVTDVGTVRVALVFASATSAPPAGAGCVRVTEQVLEAFCPRLAGLHTKDDTSTGATRLIVALAELLL